MPLVTKLGRDVTFPEGVPYISSYDPFDYVVLGDHVTNQKYYIYIYIYITTMPMATKLGRPGIKHE